MKYYSSFILNSAIKDVKFFLSSQVVQKQLAGGMWPTCQPHPCCCETGQREPVLAWRS